MKVCPNKTFIATRSAIHVLLFYQQKAMENISTFKSFCYIRKFTCTSTKPLSFLLHKDNDRTSIYFKSQEAYS